MTTNIVVMNKGGIAIAADSAVTVRGRKVYNSADKIFEPKKGHALGVTVYGKGHFMNTPWSVIIQTFGDHLPEAPFDTVHEYVEAFAHFLNDNEFEELMAREIEENFQKELLYRKIDDVFEVASNVHRNTYEENQANHSLEEIQQIYQANIEERLKKVSEKYEQTDYFPAYDDVDYEKIERKYTDELKEYMTATFPRFLFTDHIMTYALFISYHALLKNNHMHKANLVFAGYGKRQLHPSVIAIEVGTKIHGKLKWRKIDEKSRKLGVYESGCITGFAQSDMIKSFMTGIHEKLEDCLLSNLESKFEKIPSILFEKCKHLIVEDVDKAQAEQLMREELVNLYRAFNQETAKMKHQKFIDPVLDIVMALPTTELAEMAETLVHMQSFKLKMTNAVESVGGPIDVAVITKSEGLTWMKHKKGVA